MNDTAFETRLKSYADIGAEPGSFADRADRAVRDGARAVPGVDAAWADKERAAWVEMERYEHAEMQRRGEPGHITEADLAQIAKHFPEQDRAYRWFDGEGWKPDDSRDPDKSLLPDDYDLEQADKAWFLVRMQSVGGTLERARQFAIRKRLMPYWPRAIRVVSRGNGKRKHDVTLTTSAFGSYAMVHMPYEGGRAPFGVLTDQEARNHGVGGYVEFGRGPERMPSSLVAKVAEMEASGAYDHTKRKGAKRYAKTEWEPQRGDPARVVDGPFASFNCVVEAFDEVKGMIDVWIDIFGRATLCHLELAQVARL